MGAWKHVRIPDRTEHYDDIDEDGEVAEQQHPRVLEGLPLQRLEEHSGTVKLFLVNFKFAN